ncbi:hypothetical protein DFJ74DRAFT_658671 [Hyaloraphidium curvatum]|nr:hypothetical protein DFJ74DRAFT_658671 [Hyaloraphidium curvatum]
MPAAAFFLALLCLVLCAQRATAGCGEMSWPCFSTSNGTTGRPCGANAFVAVTTCKDGGAFQCAPCDYNDPAELCGQNFGAQCASGCDWNWCFKRNLTDLGSCASPGCQVCMAQFACSNNGPQQCEQATDGPEWGQVCVQPLSCTATDGAAFSQVCTASAEKKGSAAVPQQYPAAQPRGTSFAALQKGYLSAIAGKGAAWTDYKAAPGPKADRSGVVCVEGLLTPVKLTADGNPACVSADGANCVWTPTPSDCSSLAAASWSGTPVLECGAAMAEIWGSTGYEDPGSWCSKAKAGLAKMGYA